MRQNSFFEAEWDQGRRPQFAADGSDRFCKLLERALGGLELYAISFVRNGVP